MLFDFREYLLLKSEKINNQLKIEKLNQNLPSFILDAMYGDPYERSGWLMLIIRLCASLIFNFVALGLMIMNYKLLIDKNV